MRFQVFKIAPNCWRFTDLHDIAGECDTHAEAIAEASDLAWLARPLEQTA